MKTADEEILGLRDSCSCARFSRCGHTYTLETAIAAEEAKPVDYTTTKPADLVASTPKGKIENPYKDTQADIVAQGEHLYLSYGCNGCHGGGGAAACARR